MYTTIMIDLILTNSIKSIHIRLFNVENSPFGILYLIEKRKHYYHLYIVNDNNVF